MKPDNTAGMLLGLAAGAALMYLLDPQGGRRRRSLMTQKMSRIANLTEEAIGTTSRDAANRTRGLIAEITSWFRSESPDERMLSERVRSRLGFLVEHPSSIDAAAWNGRITLSGPVLAHEVERLLDEVRRIPGVQEVVNHLDVHKEPGDISGLQGGPSRRRRGAQFEFMQENWAPTARVLAGAAGAALVLWGLRERDVPGTLLSTLGLGLVARAATNMDLQRLTGLGAGRRAIEINKTIRIAAPIDKVYGFWRDFEQYSCVMSVVREVREAQDGLSHWVLEGPGGIPITFDVRVVQETRPTWLAWRSEPGSSVQHSGIAQFHSDGNEATTVHLRMSYNPIAGALGHAAAGLMGYDLKSLLDEELMRMKSTIETGKFPERKIKHARAACGHEHLTSSAAGSPGRERS
jgi:uncharacterized membrane protein